MSVAPRPPLQAKYAAMVVDVRAEQAALSGMHSCCAEAVQADKGCCGMDATALQAKYDQAVTDAKAKQVSAADCATSCGSAATKTAGAATTATSVATTSK